MTIDGAQHDHSQYYTESESDTRFLRKNADTTLAGQLTINDPSAHSAKLGDTFTSGTDTKKNKICFTRASSSNDNGQIIHETSSETGDTNKGVLHLCPSDDDTNAGTDYVSIHGSDEPENIKLHTGGNIEASGTVSANSFTNGEGAPIPFVIYANTGPHDIAVSLPIKFPKTGMYRITAEIHARRHPAYDSYAHVHLDMGSSPDLSYSSSSNTTVGRWFGIDYGDVNFDPNYHVSAATGVGYMTESSATRYIVFTRNTNNIQELIVKNIVVEWIAPNDNFTLV